MTSTTALWLLLGFWISGHILLFGILFKKTKYLAVALSMILLASVYATKPATFDLPRYSVYFETGVAPWITQTDFKKEGWQLAELDERERNEYGNFFPRSPAFNFLLDVTRNLLPDGSYLPRIITDRAVADSLVLLVVVLGLALLVATFALIRELSQKKDQKLYLYCLAIGVTLGSVFFFVGSQNALRQFLGSSLSILAFAAYTRNWLSLAAFGFLLSFLFHPWSLLLAVFGIAFFKARHFTQVFCLTKMHKIFFNEYVLALVFGIASVIVVKIGIKLGIPDFTTYFHIDTSGEIFRSSSGVKLILVASVLVMTDLIAGRMNNEQLLNLPSLRRCFLILLAPLVLYPEIFSRLLMFYFAVELIYLVWALSHNSKRVQLSGCIVYSAYAFALNALNILLDKNWPEILFYG